MDSSIDIKLDKNPLVKELLLPNEVKSESQFYVKTENCDSAGDESSSDVSSNSDSEFSEQDDESCCDDIVERPHKCTYCNKGFASPAHVKVHERIHSGRKPYKCNEWGNVSHSCLTCELIRKYTTVIDLTSAWSAARVLNDLMM